MATKTIVLNVFHPVRCYVDVSVALVTIEPDDARQLLGWMDAVAAFAQDLGLRPCGVTLPHERPVYFKFSGLDEELVEQVEKTDYVVLDQPPQIAEGVAVVVRDDCGRVYLQADADNLFWQTRVGEILVSTSSLPRPVLEEIAGVATKPVLEVDPVDNRLLCPECGGRLYVAIKEYTSGVPVWAGADEGQGSAYGVTCDSWDGSHHETEIEAFYCESCDFRRKPDDVLIPEPETLAG